MAGLPTEVTAEQLAQRFKPFGQVQEVELAKSKTGSTLEPGQCRGFGHLELEADEQALKRCLSLVSTCLSTDRCCCIAVALWLPQQPLQEVSGTASSLTDSLSRGRSACPLSISVVACWHDSTAVLVVTGRVCILLTVRVLCASLKAYRHPNLIYAWCVAIENPAAAGSCTQPPVVLIDSCRGRMRGGSSCM